MKNLLLGIIAINLTIISINMTLKSIEPANAASGVQMVAICNTYIASAQRDRYCAEVSIDGILKTRK